MIDGVAGPDCCSAETVRSRKPDASPRATFLEPSTDSRFVDNRPENPRRGARRRMTAATQQTTPPPMTSQKILAAVRAVSQWWSLHFLLVVCFLAAALGLYALGDKPLWLDEVGSAYLTKDWAFMCLAMHNWESNMWLYYVLMHYWQMAGIGEAWLRLPSVIAAVLTIPAIYWLARLLYSETSARLAALLLAFNAFFVRYAQEARSYSLHLLLATIAACFLVLAVRKQRWRWWLGYCLLTIAGIYTHLFSLFVFSAQIASLAFLGRRQIPLFKAAICTLITALSLAPIVTSPAFHNHGIGWISPLTWERFHAFLVTLSGESELRLLLFSLLAAAGVAMGIRHIAMWRFSYDSWAIWFPVVWILLVPLQVMVYSAIARPLFVDRYLVSELIPLCVLGAGLLSYQAARLPSLAWIVLYIAFAIEPLCRYYSAPFKSESDWRSVDAYIQSRGSPNDVVLVYPYWCKPPVEYYLKWWRDRLEVPGVQIVEYHGAYPSAGEPLPDMNVLSLLGDHFNRVWQVTGRERVYVNDAALVATRDYLDRHFTLAEKKEFPDGSAVRLYERAPYTR